LRWRRGWSHLLGIGLHHPGGRNQHAHACDGDQSAFHRLHPFIISTSRPWGILTGRPWGRNARVTANVPKGRRQDRACCYTAGGLVRNKNPARGHCKTRAGSGTHREARYATDPPSQHTGCVTGSSRNVRHEQPVRHTFLEVLQHPLLSPVFLGFLPVHRRSSS
jgi:hypothetical protein